MLDFTFKGTRASDLGILISELPDISRAPMRHKESQVDGRDGATYEALGYGPYVKVIEIAVKGLDNINQVLYFLSGQGNLIVSNEPDVFYQALILNQIDFKRLGRFRTATVIFQVQPFKFKVGETLTNSLAVTNHGTLDALPYMKITGSGTVTLSINSSAVCTLTIGSEAYLELDSEKQECYKGGTLKNRLMNGKFPVLRPGANTISTTGTVSKAETLVRSRYV